MFVKYHRYQLTIKLALKINDDIYKWKWDWCQGSVECADMKLNIVTLNPCSMATTQND